MPEMWYYTTHGKQMDPIPTAELARLASEGVLKPTDMVWKDGMARWVRASTVKDLYPDPSSTLDPYFTKSGSQETADQPAAEPALAKRPAAPDDDFDEARPQRRRRPAARDDDPSNGRARRPNGQHSGSSTAVTIALVVGAMLVLGSLAVGGVILILMSQTPVPISKINPSNLIRKETKYTVDVAPRGAESRKFSFRKGIEYEILVKTETPGKDIDVDLHIFHDNGREVTKEDLPDRDCNLRWIPIEDGEYRVEIRNVINPNVFVEVPIHAKVTIREFKDAPLDEKDPGREEPLPPGVKEGNGVWDTPLLTPGKSFELRLRVKGGHPAHLRATPLGNKANANLNLEVFKDGNNGALVKTDTRPDQGASVDFTLPATEIVRVRITNASKTASNKCTVIYNVSP